MRPSRILAALAAAALAVGAWLAFVPGGRRPDIVVLLWDTTRADRLSAYGHPRETTPWLRTLAARGVLYEQCRAPAPWTLPSHASLFTGLLPRHHGCNDHRSAPNPEHVTLAERLRDVGYDTILVSNNPLVGTESGFGQGFDVVRIVMVQTDQGPRPSAEETVNVVRAEMAAKRADPARARKPLFLFVNLMEPHLPYSPPAAIERPWRPAGVTEAQVRAAKLFQNPFEMRHNLGVQPADPVTLSILPGLYDGEIRDLDDHCARLEKVLEEAEVLGRTPDGKERDAILAVTSDHGENLNEHGLLDHKVSTTDYLLRVPLVVRWPGRLEGGRRESEQVRLQDLFPTLLEAAGAAVPARAHAASLLTAPIPGRLQVSEFPPPLAFLTEMRLMMPNEPTETFALFQVGILAATGPVEGGRHLKWERRTKGGALVDERLYDLVADPGEMRDLLGGASQDPKDLEAARRLAVTADGWVAAPAPSR